MRTILHIDMDAFYASVEQRDNPALRGKPVIVGGSSRRGVVLAASYEVRPFGVHSAMSMGEALRRAPGAVVVAPRRDAYERASDDVFEIFRRVTPLVEPLSLDEAFLDVTDSRALFGDGAEIARGIMEAVRREVRLTASAGVAECKFVAKIASDFRKPDGLVTVAPGQAAAFLEPLPVERMWGVGPKTAPKLRALGYRTIGDLARAGAEPLAAIFGAWGRTVHRLASGVDDRHVISDASARSIGAEETYEEDMGDPAIIARTLLAHSRRVARRLVRCGVAARTITVKIKYTDFALRTRRATLAEPIQDTDAIHRVAVGLLQRVALEGRSVRLTGVSVSSIAPVEALAVLFPDVVAEKRRRVEALIAKLADRYGDEDTVTRASLLQKPR